MDHGQDECTRQALHELVTHLPRRFTLRPALFVKPLLLAMVALSLVAGVLGGLLRVGMAWRASSGTDWAGHALVWHAALMICGFLGTVIGIERAVAVKLRSAFLAPVASGAGGVALLTGHGALGGALITAAALIFTVVNIVIVHRQRAAHTLLLLVSALAWLIGSVLFVLGVGAAAALLWWFTFLVMTIAAERLEMTRLMRRRPTAHASFFAIVSAIWIGAAWSAVSPMRGGVLYGAALSWLAAWLIVYDIARRTVFAKGLSRYMAVCLLGGYAWLMAAGVAWAAMALGWPTRDIAFHALALGFVISMVMGHAPVILPAIARIKLQFGSIFYLPLAALHLSLAARLGWGFVDDRWRAIGAVFNVVALVMFAATLLGGTIAWRMKHGSVSARVRIERKPS